MLTFLNIVVIFGLLFVQLQRKAKSKVGQEKN